MKNVADLFPLTPMQRVMLLHSLGAAGSDTLFNQFVYRLRGPLDRPRFGQAWQALLERHGALRTMFAWEGLDEPLQVVRKELELVVEEQDWVEIEEDRLEERLQGFLAEDRLRGFDLQKAPLMRLSLLKRGPEEHLFVWSSHHLILDRWCIGLLLQDWADGYASERPRRRPAAGRFRDYVAWIQAQDQERAHAYWRDQLDGYQASMRCLSVELPGPHASRVAHITLSPGEAQGLRDKARRLRLTPSILLQAAWALCLQARSHSADVGFGVTVAGRPASLPRVETMVGSFISNVPVRVRWSEGATLGDWLRGLHRQAQERLPYEYVTPAEMHAWSGLEATEPLFDSLFVWLAPVDWELEGDLKLEPRAGQLETPFPVTVSVQDTGTGLQIQVRVSVGDLDPQKLGEGLCERLRELLDSDEGQAVEALTGFRVEAKGEGHLATTTVQETEAAEPLQSVGGREPDELPMLEDMVLGECRAVLGREDVRIEDSFFELGGNSLLAAHLHAQLERITGRSIPMLSLFQCPSLGDMAHFLARGDWPVRAGLVRPIRARGSKPTLFCFSSPEVNSIGYVLLSRHLPEDQPVAVVQSPPGTDEVLRMAITAIPELALKYADAIVNAQPEGPYRLFGMCDGALIAVELARVLHDRGLEVDFVGVLNTSSLGTLSRLYALRRVQRMFEYYGQRVGEVWSKPWPERRAELLRVLGAGTEAVPQPTGAQAENAVVKEESPGPRPEGESSSGSQRTLEEIDHEWRTLDRPGGLPARDKYPGTVTLFRIRKMPYWRVRDPLLGWGQHAQQVRVVPIEESSHWGHQPDRRPRREIHLGLLREPDVHNMAAIVAEQLASLSAAASASGDRR